MILPLYYPNIVFIITRRILSIVGKLINKNRLAGFMFVWLTLRTIGWSKDNHTTPAE